MAERCERNEELSGVSRLQRAAGYAFEYGNIFTAGAASHACGIVHLVDLASPTVSKLLQPAGCSCCQGSGCT